MMQEQIDQPKEKGEYGKVKGIRSYDAKNSSKPEKLSYEPVKYEEWLATFRATMIGIDEQGNKILRNTNIETERSLTKQEI